MRLAVPRETAPRETRVALVPETVARLVKAGLEIAVQAGAGERAGFLDAAYREAGATIGADLAQTLAGANAVALIREPEPAWLAGVPEGAAVLGFLGRGENAALIDAANARRLSLISLQAVPRISRAQKMDALSSMASVAGYRAVLLATQYLGRFFPLLMTAAGTIPPARVFVLGAGVAGLQAIATAKRLGAVVEAFDVRPAVKEEVMSLGATFVGLEGLGAAAVGEGGYAKELSASHEEAERKLIASRLPTTDVIVTTAAIPGRRAPVLVTRAMVESMKPGSVIVDLAADSGGNCELTRPGETVTHAAVTIAGPLDIAATLPTHASQMLSRNLAALITHYVQEGAMRFDFADEITRGATLTHEGRRASELAAANKGA